MSASCLQPTIDGLTTAVITNNQDIIDLSNEVSLIQQEISGGVLGSTKWGIWYLGVDIPITATGIQETAVQLTTNVPGSDTTTISFMGTSQLSVNVPGIYQFSYSIGTTAVPTVSWTDTLQELILFDNADAKPLSRNSIFVPSGESMNMTYTTTVYIPSSRTISLLFRTNLDGVSGGGSLTINGDVVDYETFLAWTLIATV
jgi:hypothetical protein